VPIPFRRGFPDGFRSRLIRFAAEEELPLTTTGKVQENPPASNFFTSAVRAGEVISARLCYSVLRERFSDGFRPVESADAQWVFHVLNTLQNA
jgi:hypothetical protein